MIVAVASFCLLGAQQAPAPIGELFAATEGSARLVQPAGAGMSVVSGSELSAGIATARLKLYRGGQVRICPHTNLTVNSAPLGLMFAMDAGAVEIDYTLPTKESGASHAADLLIIPDFSIQMAAPGRYHFALATNKQGDTCVKSLPGNSAPVQISELLDSNTSQLGPQESVRFHDGKLKGSVALIANEACGCPETVPVQQAAAEAPAATKEQVSPPEQPQQPVPQPAPVVSQSNPPPAEQPAPQVTTKVEAPFVFSAKNAPGLEPYSVARLTFSSLANLYFVQETVDPVVLEEKPAVVSVREEPPPIAPVPEKKKEKKGFFGKLKGFFGGLFGR